MAMKQLFYKFTKMKSPMFQLNPVINKFQKYSTGHFITKPIAQKLCDYSNNMAVIDPSGAYTYGDILCYSKKLQKMISNSTSGSSPKNVAMMCPNDSSYVASLIACWLSGSTVVPLCKDHPLPYLEYFLKDSQCSLVIVNKTLSRKLKPLAGELGLPVVEVENPLRAEKHSHFETETKDFAADDLDNLHEQGAMIIYTSGTTGSPKGVVLTHGNFCAQVSSIVNAWKWSSNDTMLHALPLHHIHGILYALLCPLDVGACIVMLPKFDAFSVWEHLLDLPKKRRRTSLFFGVPTMYSKLLETYEDTIKMKKINKENCRKLCLENMRLMSCGSAALPEPVFLRFEEATGHRILERYGSTEIGMALSNPLNGPRIPGSVGVPLPGVGTCISRTDECDDNCYVYGDGQEVKCAPDYQGEPGNLLVKGPNVFKMYWNKPVETESSFTSDGWFKTGDTASYENGYFRILGRTSVDIIKSGGYKISALDIESVLLSHKDIAECTVIGVPDETWGEKVVAVILTKAGNKVLPSELKTWCMERLPRYCIPSEFKFVTEIPRNHMGKVNKKEFKMTFSK